MTDKPEKKQENELFLQSVGEVTPVKSDKHSIVSTQKPKPYPKKTTPYIADKLTRIPTGTINILQAQDTLSYSTQGLQKNVLKKMRRGDYQIDTKIDLHGLTSVQAERELVKFLQRCEQDGYRYVHIIHGKGYGSENKQPVLKNNLNIWLRQHQQVLAFCSTAPKYGGTGAVVVLLNLTDKYTD